MREILHCQLGQCGNQLGTKFWESIIKEHGIDKNGFIDSIEQKGFSDVFFNETQNGRYVPRSILIDLEPGPIDAIKGSDIGSLFRPDNFICGEFGAGNNWAKGHVTDGADLMEQVMDVVRHEVEICDSLQGFQIVHSLGGGTGSGLGTLLCVKLADEYHDRIISTFSVVPSPVVSNVILEPYNSILAMNTLIEYSDSTVIFDNEALYRICQNRLRLSHFSNPVVNQLVAAVMAGVTTSLRFPGQLNADLRKLAVNMIPFARLHFLLCGSAPLVGIRDIQPKYSKISDLIQQMFNTGNLMAACDPRNGRYLTCAGIFRGQNVSTKEVEEELAKFQNSNSTSFVEWIPNSFKSVICDIPFTSTSGTFLANNTSIQIIFSRLLDQFRLMFNRRAYLQHYENEGMSADEFKEAASNVGDLISLYQQCQSIPNE